MQNLSLEKKKWSIVMKKLRVARPNFRALNVFEMASDY